MPDAGRTRGPCVQKNVHLAHASNDRAAGTAGTPCATVLRLIRALLGVPGFRAAVASRETSREKLDPGIGGSGPHDFAVRLAAARHAAQSVHRIPRPTLVTIAKRPSWRGTGRGEKIIIFGKMELDYFAPRRLTVSDKWKRFARRAKRGVQWIPGIASLIRETPLILRENLRRRGDRPAAGGRRLTLAEIQLWSALRVEAAQERCRCRLRLLTHLEHPCPRSLARI